MKKHNTIITLYVEGNPPKDFLITGSRFSHLNLSISFGFCLNDFNWKSAFYIILYIPPEVFFQIPFDSKYLVKWKRSPSSIITMAVVCLAIKYVLSTLRFPVCFFWQSPFWLGERNSGICVQNGIFSS